MADKRGICQEQVKLEQNQCCASKLCPKNVAHAALQHHSMRPALLLGVVATEAHLGTFDRTRTMAEHVQRPPDYTVADPARLCLPRDDAEPAAATGDRRCVPPSEPVPLKMARYRVLNHRVTTPSSRRVPLHAGLSAQALRRARHSGPGFRRAGLCPRGPVLSL